MIDRHNRKGKAGKNREKQGEKHGEKMKIERIYEEHLGMILGNIPMYSHEHLV